MQQDDNVRNWIDCWKASRGNSERMKGLGDAELWNRRADGFAEKLSPDSRRERTQEIFALLDGAGFQAEGARVLDIGCGPGAISIPLARAGAEVTSLDISSRALEHLRANAEKEGLPVEAIECSWWTADIDEMGFRNRFDLVVTSMTPAVKDLETFERMIACSRGYCYYSHFIRRGGNKKHEEIYREILKRDSPARPGGAISSFMNNFMYLYLNGHRPLVRINHNRHKNETGWAEAAERAIKSVERAETLTEETKQEIRDYYEKSATDGKYLSESGVYTGMMVWNVNR